MTESLNDLKVLNIEDSEDDSLLLLRELRRSGLNVILERVETAEELRAALAKQSWDVIISDYHLPKFDASDALEIIKQSHSELPFIVVSGTIGELSAVKLMKAGAHDYLMKGNLARLAEAVRREVREAQIRVERQLAKVELDQTKERLQSALEGSDIGLWDWFVQIGAVTINERFAGIMGYTIAELEPISIETWRQNVHPDDLLIANLALERNFRQEAHSYECEMRMRHKSGGWVWVLSKGRVVEWDISGKPQRMIGTHLDINDRKQAELLVEIQNSNLKRIAKGERLADILDGLVLAIESQLEGAICSILLCDLEGKLHHGAAPNLPDAYNQSIEGLSIGEGICSYGTSVLRKEPVIVSDIATDPLWQNFKELALSYDLRSCWSYPVIASDATVLATFVVYHHNIHSPQRHELEVVALAGNLVKIAIEREQATQALEQLNQELEDRVQRRTEALQQSESRLREAQQIAHLGSWELDVLTQKITWSEETFNIFSLDPNCPEPTYEEFLQYFASHEQECLRLLNEQAIQEREPYSIICKIIRPDGSNGYIFIKAEAIWDAVGQVTRLFGIAMDISDRYTMQQALQRSEERSRATLLALPDLVYRVNRNGQYVDFLVSPQGKNLIEPKQVIGKRLNEVLPADIAEAQFSSIEQALSTQALQIYEQQVWLKGELIYEEVRVAPCGNDEVVFFIRDISDRKQSEIKLQQQIDREHLLMSITQRMRSSLDLAQILNATVNEVRQFLQSDRVLIYQVFPGGTGAAIAESVSPNWIKVLGVVYPEEVFPEQNYERYVKGRIYTLSDREDPEQFVLPCLVDFLCQIQVRAKVVVPIVYHESLWGLLIAHQCDLPRQWQEWEIELLKQIAIQLAIAIQQAGLYEQIQAELLERQQAELKLIESNQQLAISNQELARATKLKDEFLANMSHELRTPLNAILGMTEGLQEQVFGTIVDRQLKALQTIESSGTHLLELINDILDVAKIESGQIELELVSTSIHYLCQSSLTFIKQVAIQKNIQIHPKFQANLPEILVDERRIRQVLINLLNNAVKFTPAGGSITLKVSLTQENPEEGKQEAKQYIQIAVTDTGIGIAAENIPKLFKPFVQIDSALNRQYNGTGLGLALVKQIVELHGGRVGLTSELGKGSCFFIEFPYMPNVNDSIEISPNDRSIETSELDLPDQNPLLPPLILIAEDNEANIMTISSYLTAKGYRLVMAGNGQEAIDQAISTQPDLILMDIQMPVMDGFEATKQIRQIPSLVNIPIIALTALAMTGDQDRCLEAGANDYLSKPVKLKQLSTTIQQLLASQIDR